MRILITGATGFVGTHLCDYLIKNTEAEIYGLDLIAKDQDNIKLLKCDLTDKHAVADCINDIKPDYVFHLAAIASVPTAWKDPGKVLINNTICELNILEALVKNNLKSPVLITSTGEVYGLVKAEDLPINENAELKPNNPYAVSKLTQEFLGYQYFESYEIPVIITRSFNHTGPGQRGDFVVPSFVRQIVNIEQHKSDAVMYVGNLEAKRDFTDVRDVVRAYWQLATKGAPGQVYNVCSGSIVKIKWILNTLLKNAKVSIEVREDSEKMRPSDTPVVMGDNSKLKQITGWQPEINIEDTLKDTLQSLRVTGMKAELSF